MQNQRTGEVEQPLSELCHMCLGDIYPAHVARRDGWKFCSRSCMDKYEEIKESC